MSNESWIKSTVQKWGGWLVSIFTILISLTTFHYSVAYHVENKDIHLTPKQKTEVITHVEKFSTHDEREQAERITLENRLTKMETKLTQVQLDIARIEKHLEKIANGKN